MSIPLSARAPKKLGLATHASVAPQCHLGLATHASVAPQCQQLLLAMTKLLLLVLAKPGLKKTLLRPVHDRLPK